MANTKYYLAETYTHYRHKFFPRKRGLADFPTCPWCGADIIVDDLDKKWICSNPNCRLS